MKVLFIAGFGPIAEDVEKSRDLYEDALDIAFKIEDVDYRHTEELKGANSFAVWPLYQAAQSCFGSREWPADIPRPQAWLEFDVDDVGAASREIESRGYKLLVSNRTEPWGQVVSRLISPEGLLVGLTMTPWMRDKLG
ncbi:MAG TPA: VOC family protein [Candidatus Dormibacteraeota bacterium]|nr:VOC family protein [Candidatus Dormibacteraeota bacterium]